LTDFEKTLAICSIVLGVAYAHDQGVIHGNLRPSNVFVCAGDIAKIGDFGRRATDGRTIVACYTAAEQLIGAGAATKATDIYSLALTIVFILREAHVFDETLPPGELAKAIMRGAAIPRCPGLAPEIAALIKRMTSTEPEARPTASEAWSEICRAKFAFFDGIDAVEVRTALAKKFGVNETPFEEKVEAMAREIAELREEIFDLKTENAQLRKAVEAKVPEPLPPPRPPVTKAQARFEQDMATAREEATRKAAVAAKAKAAEERKARMPIVSILELPTEAPEQEVHSARVRPSTAAPAPGKRRGSASKVEVQDGKGRVLLPSGRTVVVSVAGIWTKANTIDLGDLTGCAVTLPLRVTSIENEAFKGSSLISLTTRGNCTRIGDEAFAGCNNLATVVIQQGCTTIGRAAFSGCAAIVALSIPANCGTIGKSAFRGCTGITSLQVQHGCHTVDDGAFDGCANLAAVTIPRDCQFVSGTAFANCPRVQLRRV
jgi:hypothetical protein